MRASKWLLWLLLSPAIAFAGGPRFVTGPPFFTGPQGVPIGWKQPNLLYYTDPGALGTAVNHQASDALVAAAGSVWNVPQASISIAQGGQLAEHVNGQNAYLDASGLVFPDDVMAANAAAIPIAILYDTDGSITDMLLGSGASNPSGCRQNAVTQTVDRFDPAGYILHAIIVLNGRCTGPAPELQLEMQYQLQRAFGRVLGLAWSQTNDNVFTGTPTPTHAQAMAWPIMHPLDIICGPYAYQCLPSPFQLRPDDVASLVTVYPIAWNATPPAGKQPSDTDADFVVGHISFPTGQGMAGVNVLVQREPQNGTAFDSFYEASAVTGATFRTSGSSPFVTPDTSALGSLGSQDPSQMGAYNLTYIPMWTGAQKQNLLITTEPINPLYIGPHSLGPYPLGVVSPSGSPTSLESLLNPPFSESIEDAMIPDAAATCGNGEDGTPSAPMALPATGWWNGLLCGYGHASYIQTAVAPGRTLTVEVTALDAQGLATESKAMPVIGLFAPTDAPGALPSLGLTPSAFQSTIVGMSSLSAQTGQLTSIWFGIADQRGDGRPDYSYQSRFFYADNIIPAQLGPAGGPVTINGTGFRPGNAVSINGVAAKVLNWTANAISVTAPSMASAQATSGTPVDIAIADLSTGATSTMTAALTYTSTPSLPNILHLISAPSAPIYVDDAATPPFAVQLLLPDGVTPVAGQSITFSASAGSAQFAPCNAATCTVQTDAQGIASIGVTPQSAGTVTLLAAVGTLTQTVTFAADAQTGSLALWSAPTGNQPIGSATQPSLALTDYFPNNGGRSPGRSITFTVLTGTAIFSGCAASVCRVTTDASGNAQIGVTPTAIGPVTIQAADGDVTVTTSFTAVSNTDIMTIAQLPLASVVIGNYSGRFAVSLSLPDGVTPDFNESVNFTAPAGVILSACGSNVCSSSTGWSGTANLLLYATQPGTFTVKASFGGVSQSATFTVTPHVIQFNVISAPTGNNPVGISSAVPFAAQLVEDGIPLTYTPVSISGQVGAVVVDACQAHPACQLLTDSNGIVSTTVTPLRPGTITVSAVFAPYSATASFTAVGVPETMTILQQPPPTIYVGDPVVLEVQMLGPGGVSPMFGDPVTFSIDSGPFGFSDWFTASTIRQTDGNGDAFEYGVASAAGPVTVTASDGVVSQTMTFLAIARPDVMQLVSAPANGGAAGVPASIPFAVQVFAYDGTTPLAGRSVTISVTNGAASFAACNGAATCQVVTDAQGVISTMATPLASGAITVLATEGGVEQSASFTAIPGAAPPQLSLVALNSTTYIATGATVTFPLNASAIYNSSPAVNQAVEWSFPFGFGAARSTTVTNSSGLASEPVILGPLPAGGQATATACAWGNVCTQFQAFGVDPSVEAIAILSGNGQSVTSGAPLAPVIVMIVDAAGHPVAAAPVNIYQAAYAFDASCPSTGRCPAAEILASQALVLSSGLDGSISVVPLVVPGVATHTEIAFSVGTQGFATLAATSQP